MFTEKDIKDAFEASGGRMDDMDGTIAEMKAYIDQTLKQLKRLGKGLISGTVDGNDYPGFWPDESMAKGFAGVFAQAAKRKFAGIEEKDMGTMGPEGGVLVPDEMAGWIIQKLGVYGRFRRNAMVVKMGTGRQHIPKISTDLTIYAPGEGKTITKSDVTFAMVKLEAIKLACLTVINSELDEDAIIGVAEVVGMSVARSLAKKEDLIGFLGDGSSTYFGMTGIVGALLGVDETIGNIKSLVVASGNAYGEIDTEDFRKVLGMLPEDGEIGAKWYMSKRFYYECPYRLAMGLGVASMYDFLSNRKERYLLGFPVEYVSCMPSVAANNQICAIFGDLKLGAFLGERRHVEIAKSSEAYFADDQIGIRATERIDINAHGVGDTEEPGPIVALITAGV